MSRVGDVADWLGGQIGGWVCDRQHPALEDGDEAESATSEDE